MKAPCLLFRSGAFLWVSGEMDLSAWTAGELLGRESLGKLLQTVTKLQHHPDLLQPRTRSCPLEIPKVDTRRFSE